MGYFKIQFAYGKITFFLMCCFVNFSTWMDSHNNHLKQDTELFHHPPNPPCVVTLWLNVTSTPRPNGSGNNWPIPSAYNFAFSWMSHKENHNPLGLVSGIMRLRFILYELSFSFLLLSSIPLCGWIRFLIHSPITNLGIKLKVSISPSLGRPVLYH